MGAKVATFEQCYNAEKRRRLPYLLIYIGADIIHHLFLDVSRAISGVIDLIGMNANRVDNLLGIGSQFFRLSGRPGIALRIKEEKRYWGVQEETGSQQYVRRHQGIG